MTTEGESQEVAAASEMSAGLGRRRCLRYGNPAWWHCWTNIGYESLNYGNEPVGVINKPSAIIEYDDGSVAVVDACSIEFIVDPDA